VLTDAEHEAESIHRLLEALSSGSTWRFVETTRPVGISKETIPSQTQQLHSDPKETSVKPNLILTTSNAVLNLCALLAFGVSAMAQANNTTANSHTTNGGCANRTIFGDYGGDARGLLLPAPGVSIEFRGLSMTHFDGKGNLTWVEHTVVGGNPVNPGWLEASGTYTVNPDCTGEAVVNTPNSPVPLKFFFVVVKRGKEIRAVLDSNAIATVFIKVQ
jgi:hypothetical protein